MEALDSYHNSNDMPRFHRLPQIMKNLFRITEIFLIVVVLITRLPLAVKIISVVISHNLFIFLIGNVIVLMIFLNSRRNFSSTAPAAGHSQMISTESGHYLGFIISQLEFIIATNSTTHFPAHDHSSGLQQDEVVIFQDKHTLFEVTKANAYGRRSQSLENLREALQEERRRVEDDGGEFLLEMVDDHELSNEEFQRAVEDFIAKQIKFHQLEKHAFMDFHDSFYGMKSH